MEPKTDHDGHDDELLSALLDGELDDAAADALTARLAREPQLAKRLEMLRGSDESVRALFAKIDELPMPQGVLDTIKASRSKDASAANNVIPFPRRVFERFANVPVAIAASVALAAGFLADRLLDENLPATAGIAALQAAAVPQDSGIHALLENAASAAVVKLPDGSEGRVLLTFSDENGDWCRQLSIESSAASVQALACRRNGSWRNEVLAFGNPAGGEYQSASATSTAVISSAIDRLIGERQPLDAIEESQLIQEQWRKNP